GVVVKQIPGLESRIQSYRDRLWSIFENRLDEEIDGIRVPHKHRLTESDASTIATTELSKLQSSAEMDAERDIVSYSTTRVVAVWRTEPGSCDQCSPMDGRTDWRLFFPDGPGSPHPNCRCWLEWRKVVG
ncbi:MAG: phage head morphogenesis protein, partial [bacterium]|nr:phage head morphogenesis protein [bacterium]